MARDLRAVDGRPEPDPEALHLFDDGALGIGEAEELSHLSRSTLYELMEAGRLPYTKIGRRRLIPRRALLRLLAEGLRGGARP